jgi:DNA repair protein RadC
MVVNNRDTGISALGSLPFGSHICVFYGTTQDLVDTLVPYFKAGLENNELCVWITAPLLGKKRAMAAISKEIPDLNRYLLTKQLEFTPYTTAYVKDGVFNMQKALYSLAYRTKQAFVNNYDGIRVAGYVAYLKMKQWQVIIKFEREINKYIASTPALGLCAYPLDKCNASELIDIMSTHQYVVDKHNGSFILLGNQGYQQALQEYEHKEEEYHLVIQNLKEELQESEDKFLKVIRNSPNIIVITTLKNGKYIEVNESFTRALGYTRDEIIGRTTSELNIWPDTKQREDMVKQLEAHGRIQDGVGNLRTKSGEILTIKYSNELHTINGQQCIINVLRDTEIKKKEEEERAIISTAMDGFWTTDINGKFLEVNDSYCQMIGYTRAELMNMSISDIEALERPEDVAQRTKKIIKQGSDRFKSSHRRKDGKIIDVEVNASFYNVGKGQLFTFVRDLSEKKETEERGEARLQTSWRKNITQLQEKFVKEGFKDFEDREIIELLLSMVMPARKAKQLAVICIDRFKNLGNFLKASPEELKQIGVTPACVFCIAMLHKLPIKVLQEKISEQSIYDSPQDIFDYFYYSMRDLKKEVFKVMFLNARNQIMEVVDLFEGTADKIAINARDVIENAIAHNTKSLIFVHNHPSGDPAPSQADRQLTRDLVFVGEILQIKVLDHIIIGENRYFSFASEGLIKEYETDFLNLKLTSTCEAKRKLSKARLPFTSVIINLLLVGGVINLLLFDWINNIL